MLKTTNEGQRYFIYAEDGVSLLGEYAAGGPVHETVYLAGIPVLVLKGGAAYYVLPDHLGTPRTVKSATGETVWRWTSDASGNGAAEDNLSGLFQFTFNQRFPGQQFDAESGLHYNNARFYDPKTGRYVTSDPIGLAGGLNSFAYAKNNPLALVDSSGNLPIPVMAVGAGLGFVYGFTGSVAAQYFFGNSGAPLDYRAALVSGGINALGGALLPLLGPGSSLIGSRFASGAVSALTGVSTTLASSTSTCGIVDPYELLQSGAIGFAVGVAGPFGALTPMSQFIKGQSSLAALFGNISFNISTNAPSVLRCLITGKNKNGSAC